MARTQEFIPVVGEQDVDDLLPGEGVGVGGVPYLLQEGIELLKRGNHAFRTGKFEEAIEAYTTALKAQAVDPSVLLSNRCAAYCRLSEQLRNIPAAVSEAPGSALFGQDPMSHVQLALRDAEKLVKLQSTWPKAYLRKATAQTLLEQYEEAHETILSGLEIDPANSLLQAGLSEVATHIQGAHPNGRDRRKLEHSDDLDCTLCLKLLYNPITTPCGHSFCRSCLLQALDHGNKCPMCRTVLFVSPKTYPISVTLNNIIQRNFQEEYQERKTEMDAITLAGNDILPLFVMDTVLPMQHVALNIFEPRYRLMVRRIMEGNRRMGMVGIDPETGAVADVACEVEISECEPVPDGRFLLEVLGRRRFRIIETWDQDGYRIAKVQWLQDVIPAPGSPEQKEVYRMARTAAEVVNTFLTRAQDAARKDYHGRLRELLNQSEGRPNISDPECFSFWIANLLPIRTAERLQFLRLTDTRERLNQEILRLNMVSTDQGCYIQ
ncbi:unnamed protein product [Sphagnum jensenii]|uniref:LON peptidase N-terminal domain and RING finger protein 1 n=1 Tax=Sphagnum jensenii TaxID=128206 RepID=A0ABP0WU59_9BRYO